MKILRVIAVFVLLSAVCAWSAEALIRGLNAPIDSEQGEEQSADMPLKKTDHSAFATGEPCFYGIDISARSAVLCSSDGLLLYERNADVTLPMASITKVMSAIIAIEKSEDLKKEITVPDTAVGIEGSSVYLARGERVTLEMLLYSAMLESANDAVTALAVAVCGSEEAFVAAMNEKAASLSMNSTSFRNPHGLSENDHFTTARDYARLMAYCLENEAFRTVIATKKAVFPKLDNSMTRVLSNHNRLLNTYSGMLGGKTGFTRSSGRTLVTAAERNGTTLICVTLDAPNDWNDHTLLFDKGFDTVKTVAFKAEDISTDITVGGGDREKLRLISAYDTSYTVMKDDEVTYDIRLPHTVFAPVKKWDTVGKAVIYKNGERIAEIPLIATEAVRVPITVREEQGIFKRITNIILNRSKATE